MADTENRDTQLSISAMNDGVSHGEKDEEEKEIIESLENLDFKAIENDVENIKKLQKAAKEYIEQQSKKNQ